jgi:hypothetical protein
MRRPGLARTRARPEFRSTDYESFNFDGTVANPNVFPLLAGDVSLGMRTNPANGHIIANSTCQLAWARETAKPPGQRRPASLRNAHRPVD